MPAGTRFDWHQHRDHQLAWSPEGVLVVRTHGGSYVLPRLVGREQALRLYLLGETWDAAAAERRGLVGQVVPDDGLESAVTALAERLAAQAPLAVARMKRHFNTAGPCIEWLHYMIPPLRRLYKEDGSSALQK